MFQDYFHRAVNMLRHPANRGHYGALFARAIRFRLGCLLGKPVDLPFLAGTRIRCWPDSDIARSVAYCAGSYDFHEMNFLSAYLRPGDTVLDVGANIGTYSVLCGRLTSPSGRVDAIEPNRRNAIRLRENLALNDLAERVQVHEIAIGETQGLASMTVGLDSVNHIASGEPHGGGNSVVVELKTLDQVAADGPIAFGKIDIEGMEWAALRGARTLLEARRPPVWLVEINGALERYGWTARSFIEWFEGCGFSACKYDSWRRVFVAKPDAWDDVFFIAKDRFNEIEARVPGVKIQR